MKTQFSSSSTSSTASPVAGATSSLSGSPVKRKRAIVRTEDPWHELTLSLTKIVNGQKTDFPLSAPSMTSAAKVLFNHAVNLLDEYQQQTPDKKDTTLIKDAQVAMSCLLNTMSPRAVNHFMFEKEEETVTDAIDSTTLSYFEEHECLAYAREYCTVLEEHGLEYLIRKLAIDRGQLFSSYPLDESLPKAVVIKEKVLRVLEKVVTIHSGEKVLEASKIMRNQQAVEYGDLSDSGRKVDLIFSYDKVELSNVEFKRQDISPKNITVQCRKNIRLGRCIQELHKSYGIKDPVVMMADVAGYVGFFYLVKPLKGISVAGKTTRSMAILPNTAGAMEVFLKGTSLAMIWNYLDFLERQGPKERDFSNVVTFSPSRKRNQKSAGLD
ncbi:hypothetical protein EC991_002969 [Linnemannia zychae]|nr:hypothetical protein EC991_002969 [Linnemannia zychae]